MYNGVAGVERVWQFLKQLSTELPKDPANPA